MDQEKKKSVFDERREATAAFKSTEKMSNATGSRGMDSTSEGKNSRLFESRLAATRNPDLSHSRSKLEEAGTKSPESEKIVASFTQTQLDSLIQKTSIETARELSKTMATKEESRRNSRLAVPALLRNLDAMPVLGDVLKLGAMGAFFGTSSASATVTGGSGGLALGPDVCFGYSISGTNVTIYSGEIHWGTRIISIGDSTKTITVTDSYVWVELNYSTESGTIATPSATPPVSDDTVFRCWLYKFALSGGTVTLSRVGHFGNIELPGNFA